MLQLFNTLSRKKEPFEPREAGKVGMYVCGITVYDFCHIGHARMFVVFDVLYRHLLSLNFAVNYVRNITDVDDKIIERARAMGEPVDVLTGRFIDAMWEDEEKLSVLRPSHEPRATQAIAQMITLIETLIEKDFAYAADNGDVYYSVSSFPDYGKLSGRKLSDMRAGERIEVDPNKRDPMDFVLWKAQKAGEPGWESPWGLGRPGWHIECSAMAKSHLGDQFDIHGGGMDLQFPHHENEKAQSEAANGTTFARYWMHNGFVQIDDEKMSKSLGNFFTVRDVLKAFSGEEVRMFMVTSHYRSPLNYSDESLHTARSALRRLYTALRDHPVDDTQSLVAASVAAFDAAMNDDLNTPEALAVLFDLANQLNKASSSNTEDGPSAAMYAHTLRALGGRLGILQQDAVTVLQGNAQSDDGINVEQIEALIAERISARANKDFAKSDEIRDQLAEQGITLEDAGGKTTWRRS